MSSSGAWEAEDEADMSHNPKIKPVVLYGLVPNKTIRFEIEQST